MPGRAQWIKLSLVYGIPVPILQTIIDSRHYAELIAFENLYTLDPEGWKQTGLVASLQYNSNRGQHDPPASAEDFMPIVRRHKQTQTIEEMQRVMRAQMKRNNRRFEAISEARNLEQADG